MTKHGEIIFTKKQIHDRVVEIAKKINTDYKGKTSEGIILVCILNGAAIFFCDLIRLLNFDFEVEYLSASSYINSTKSCGDININYNFTNEISGKHIICIDDIIESGLTMQTIRDKFIENKVASFASCVLLDKKNKHRSIKPDYKCFDCLDKFVVGYGLDYAQKYRNLPYIASLE